MIYIDAASFLHSYSQYFQLFQKKTSNTKLPQPLGRSYWESRLKVLHIYVLAEYSCHKALKH